MKIKFLTGLIMLMPFIGFSQGEYNNWYFGEHAGMTFNFGAPVALTNCAPTFAIRQCPFTVSDSAGNLLFYVGIYLNSEYMAGVVYNKNHQVMSNSTYLATMWEVYQNYFVVPKLDDDSSYYIFAMDGYPVPGYPNPLGLTYSLLDLRLNGGLGDIVAGQRNIQVPGAQQTQRMLTGIRHHNNHDVWITVRNNENSSSFLTYLITAAGINATPVISSSLFKLVYPPTPTSLIASMIRFSPDGTKVASLYKDGIADSMEYCQFNSSTGQIVPLFKISLPAGMYPNAEFSVDSKYVYVGGEDFHVYQYDATKTDSTQFVQSKVTLPYRTSLVDGFALQRGPDNKIYMAEGVDSVSVINNPTVQGLGCNFQFNILSLDGNQSNQGLPQFLQRYYVYINHNNSVCAGDSTTFTSAIWPIADSVHWNFGDPASGPADFSNLLNPSHLYSSPGSYTVELYVKHVDHRTDTAWQTITILSGPQVNLGANRTICNGDSTTFDAGACTGCAYQWKNLGTGLIVGTGQTYKTGLADSYSVTVTNSNNCSGSDTVQLFTTAVPSVTNNPLSESICSGNSTNIVLISSVAGTMFHWTANLTSGNITGFTPDSGFVINQVLTDNLATPGVVTYHITPKVGSCSGATVDYPVTVTPGDSAKVSITASTNNVCAGTSVTYTASPTNGGATPVYQWQVNGVNSGTNSNTFTYAPANNDIVTCVLTSSILVCISNNPATSNAITMTVNPLLPVSISVAASQNPVCAGNSVTFTATPVNEGALPMYQWKVNGVNAGTNNSSYTYNPANGDLVSCILTSSIPCPLNNPITSNTLSMTVNPNLPVSVTIVASANPFCQGSSVTFTATPVNGGGLPVYQWQVNGVNAGTNNSSYTYNPANGDLVSCVLTSSIPCPINNPITSNTLLMTVNSNLPAGVTIAASSNPFCPGSSVTFTATPINGGTTPAYQWKVNGVNAGTNSHTFTYNPANGDSVRCVMTSNLGCVTNNPASSAEIIMSGTLAPIVTFTSCFDTITTVNAKPIKLKGGIPLGGTYSGPGVNSLTGVFTPATAGVGTKTITYSYTNVANCSALAHTHIINYPLSIVNCGSPITDIRDNQVYKTVQIGSQCWMAEDLNYGTEIPVTQDQRDNCIPEKYHNPGSGIQHPASVYQWDELMQYDNTPADQGFCPPSWHIPTETEWNTLFAHYINNGFAGSPLKYSGYSGFNALLSGARNIDKSWDFQGFATFFWSSTQEGTTKAWAHGMNDLDPSVSVYPASRANAFSVRCLKD